jgi:DNA-binding LacI/PurR family transcriptional regulator
VSTSRIYAEDALDVGSLWTRLAIRSVEQVFSAADGATYYFDRYPDHRGPYESGFGDPNAIPMAEAIAALRAEGAEALAIFGVSDPRDMSDEIMAAVDIEQVPTVYLSWHEVRSPLAQVFYDSRYAGYQAAQHLLRKGYRNLLFLAPFTENWLVERIDGVRDAIRRARLPADTLQVYPAELPQISYNRERIDASAYRMAHQAFVDGRVFSEPATAPPRGIIAPNDQTAYAVLRAATEHGKVAGVDYGLIGFDDDYNSRTVGLTTVRPPVEDMGKEAGRLLLRALQGERSGLQVRLRAHAIPRASTSPRPERR